MCKYVDRVIQMVDGHISREIADRASILRLAGAADEMDGGGARPSNGETEVAGEPVVVYGL
jgi:hypothetical protein